MYPSTAAIVAMVLFSIFNTLIERKIKNVSPLMTMAIVYTTTLFLTLISFSPRNPAITFPHGWQWVIAILCGVMLFTADYFFYTAYHTGGSLVMVTVILALVPVCSVIISYPFGGSVPSLRQFAAALMAIGAVWLARY